MQFTVEETNLISIYDTGTRKTTMEGMTAALPYMEKDIAELTSLTLDKLNTLTDSEYSQLFLDPAEDD